MYIKYNNNNRILIEIDNYKIINPYTVRIYGDISTLQNQTGFSIYYEGNDIPVQNCSEYKYIYDISDNYVDYTNQNNIYYIYYITNKDNYVIGTEISEKDDSKVLYTSGSGKKYEYYKDTNVYVDDNGCYNYKIVSSKIQTVSQEEKEVFLKQKEIDNLIQAKNIKISELTETCQNIILNGIDYNGKHYTYNYSDQNNISNLVQMAKTTGMDVPYHADGELCHLYSPADIYAIYITEEMNVTQNTTYLNQLKAYINTLKDIDSVNNIAYGQELTGEYLKNLNNIMEHSQKIIEVLNAETSKITQ